MVEKILVGVDGSDHSLEAVRKAVTLAELTHARIMVVNVQTSLYEWPMLIVNEKIIKKYQEELFNIETKAAIEYLQRHSVEYELKFLIGNPVQEICKLADELAVIYIIIGSCGLGTVNGKMLGSVSIGVLHNTKIPTLIIPKKR